MRIEGLSVHYLGRESWVLDSVSLTHLRGRVTAVIGPSGCGKTTLVRALCGLIPHCLPSEYSGSLSLDGTEVADATVQTLAETVAYVGQSPDAAVVTRTVHDDVAFPLQNLCLPRSEITSRVHEALRGAGLIERIWDDPWTLSGGQRQRLAVAVALAMHPRLLVLDEPTSTIDTTGREEFYDLISSLTASGTAVVVIDHDLDPVLPIVDQVLALDTVGGIIAVGTPREVFMGHRGELTAGVWMPRALRDAEDGLLASSSAPEAPLTCAEAGVRVPRLADLCADVEVRYLEKQMQDSAESWQQVESIDTRDALAGRTRPEPRTSVELVDLEVPGRSPSVSMRLGGGELVGLVGPNGAGKSSILSALAGLVRSTARKAVVGGRDVGKGRHLVGYVFQNPEHQFVATTVGAELAVGGTSQARVDQLLEQFHLTAHRDHHPLTLSGGQARRLSVATMVSEERDVVVLDEPTYGQDWDNTRELMDFIDQLRHQGRTVIMATHDLELALEHCTHIIALPGPTSRTRTVPASVQEVAAADDVDEPAEASGAGAADSCTGLPEPASVPPRPQPRRGLFTSLNPLTLFASVLPVMVMVFALRNHHLNLGVLLASSVLVIAARASLRRTMASVITPWAVTALMIWILSSGSHHQETAARLYDLGDAVTGGTGIGALVALVLVSGVSTDPEALIRTLTTTFHMPYRLGAAGIASIAFITRFQDDFVLLRTARALRGVGDRWGPLAPVVRWIGSILPLMILAIQHAERVALSMDSRAFGAHRRRTEMTDEPWRARDWGVVVLTWALVAFTWNTLR